MNKYIKKAVLLIPPVKKQHEHIKELRNNIEKLCAEREEMLSSYQLQHNLLASMDSIFEDNVELSWSGDVSREQYLCMQPFTNMDIYHDGRVFTCCPTSLKPNCYIGEAYSQTFDKIWNSDIAKKLRYSVANGNFEYCSKTYCPSLQAQSEDSLQWPMVLRDVAKGVTKHEHWQAYCLDTTPLAISLCCDLSCNLHCVSCRNDVKISSSEENEKMAYMLENFVRPALKNCESLTASGEGEFFASKPIFQFYQTLSKEEFPLLKVKIITNGMLFTPERWAKLSNLKRMLSGVHVSIDAAQKETYEKLRRGGKWETICNNMEYISSLKLSGEIDSLEVSFVVQNENYRQMQDFVALARQWQVGQIHFRRLSNYGTFSPDEYMEKDVFDPKNLYYEEAVQLLSELKRQEKDLEIVENCLGQNLKFAKGKICI